MVLEIFAIGSIFLLVILIGIAVFAFWIWMIVDCAERKFRDKTDKIVWMLVLIFLHWMGALIYYIVVKRKDKK